MTLTNRDHPKEATAKELVASVVTQITAWRARMKLASIRGWHRGSISMIHLHVLAALETAGPQSMSAVAEALDVSVASATGIIDRMVRRGLVERRPDPDDRRVVMIHPTTQGLAILEELESESRALLAKVVGRLSEPELRGLAVGFGALETAVRQAIESGEIPGAPYAGAQHAGPAHAGGPARPGHPASTGAEAHPR